MANTLRAVRLSLDIAVTDVTLWLQTRLFPHSQREISNYREGVWKESLSKTLICKNNLKIAFFIHCKCRKIVQRFFWMDSLAERFWDIHQRLLMLLKQQRWMTGEILQSDIISVCVFTPISECFSHKVGNIQQKLLVGTLNEISPSKVKAEFRIQQYEKSPGIRSC